MASRSAKRIFFPAFLAVTGLLSFLLAHYLFRAPESFPEAALQRLLRKGQVAEAEALLRRRMPAPLGHRPPPGTLHDTVSAVAALLRFARLQGAEGRFAASGEAYALAFTLTRGENFPDPRLRQEAVLGHWRILRAKKDSAALASLSKALGMRSAGPDPFREGISAEDPGSEAFFSPESLFEKARRAAGDIRTQAFVLKLLSLDLEAQGWMREAEEFRAAAGGWDQPQVFHEAPDMPSLPDSLKVLPDPLQPKAAPSP